MPTPNPSAFNGGSPLTLDQIKSMRASAGVQPASSVVQSTQSPDTATPAARIAALESGTYGAAPKPAASTDTRNPFQKFAGSLLDGPATAAERTGEAIGSVGLKGADLISGGAVNNWYQQHMGYSLDQGLDKATSQPATLPVLGTQMQPSQKDTAEQVGGRALSTAALGADGIIAGGAELGAGNAMQDNKGAGEVTADAIATALTGKVLEFGFNATAPFIAKAIEKFGKPVAEKLANVIPEAYRASVSEFADKAHEALGGDAAAETTAEPSIISKANSAISSAAEKPLDAVSNGAADILDKVKTKVSGSNTGDALGSAVGRLADNPSEEVAVGARSNNPLDLYNEFHAQEEKFKADNKEDTALGLVGSRIGKNFNKVATMRRAAGDTMSSEMAKIGETPMDIASHFPKLEDELGKSGIAYDADLEKIISSRTSKMTEDDKALVGDYVKQLNTLGPKPTAAELDAFLSRVPNEIKVYKNKNNITGVTNGERIISTHIHDLAKELEPTAENDTFKGYSDAKKDYAALSNFLKEGEKYLGKKTQTGDYTHDASLAKSSVQSLLNNGKKDWLIKLEALTGYKGLDEATLATQAMKDAGNFRGNSLLELLSPESKGKIPMSKHGAIAKIIDSGMSAGKKGLVGTPAEQTRRIIQDIVTKATRETR